MNNSTAIFLINSEVRAVNTIYEAEKENGPKQPRSMFKTLDDTVAVGDFVIVPTKTRHNMTVVKVVETDVEVDFESTTQVDWIIGKVDRAVYEQTLAKEGDFIEAVKASEKRKKQDELRENLLKIIPVDEVKALPISTISNSPAAER